MHSFHKLGWKRRCKNHAYDSACPAATSNTSCNAKSALLVLNSTTASTHCGDNKLVGRDFGLDLFSDTFKPTPLHRNHSNPNLDHNFWTSNHIVVSRLLVVFPVWHSPRPKISSGWRNTLWKFRAEGKCLKSGKKTENFHPCINFTSNSTPWSIWIYRQGTESILKTFNKIHSENSLQATSS